MSINNNKNHTQKGFTLVEMLVVAPIVILVIGTFIYAIITMTGDVMASRASNKLAYDVQYALNQIESDMKIGNGFLTETGSSETGSFVVHTPQGADNHSTNFTMDSGSPNKPLIISSYATSDNPLSSTKNIIYTNSPNACGSSNISQNIPLMLNIVYFVQGTSLWRRVVMQSAIVDTDTVMQGCTSLDPALITPWQQPSCAPGDFNTSNLFCKTQDTKLIENLDTPTNGFRILYDKFAGIQKIGAITVTIDVKTTTSGRTITKSGTISAVSPNNDTSATSQITVPDAPSGLTSVGGSGQVRLDWLVPTSNNGSTTTGYKVYRGTSSGNETIIATLDNVLTYTDINLAASTTYYYKVTAVNAIGESPHNETSATTLASVNYIYTGTIANFTVPAGVTSITITAKGAQGGNSGSYVGGYGAIMKGDFLLTTGDIIKIIVGQQGSANGSRGGGGGGGTFVVTDSGMPLVIAGGGGGGGQYNTSSTLPYNASGAGSGTTGGAGLVVISGSQGGNGSSGNGGAGGSNGAGGVNGGTSNCITNAQGFGGGGFNSSGATVPQSGYGYSNGLTGGTGTNITIGGFGGGGGGGAAGGGGGGGGYSGGGGGGSGNCSSGAPGGGGGSYNSGTAQTNTAGANSGNGQVSISWGS